jgi:hypothetical protein
MIVESINVENMHQSPAFVYALLAVVFLFTSNNFKMITEQQYSEAMQSLIDYENEIFEHNQNILKGIDCEDLQSILEEVTITGKMEWSDKPKFKAENPPDKCGIFTLEFVDQWSVGMEGDSFEGFMYIKINGYDKYLKVPYSC